MQLPRLKFWRIRRNKERRSPAEASELHPKDRGAFDTWLTAYRERLDGACKDTKTGGNREGDAT